MKRERFPLPYRAGVIPCFSDKLFSKEEWQEAISYFKSAISADSGLNQSYYNLAITYLEIDESEKAQSLLNEYLQMETDEGWKNAAIRLLNRIQSAKDR